MYGPYHSPVMQFLPINIFKHDYSEVITFLYTVENIIYKKHTVPRVIEIGSNYRGFLNAVNVLCNHICDISFFHLSLQKFAQT